jgi:hypothetical protein
MVEVHEDIEAALLEAKVRLLSELD